MTSSPSACGPSRGLLTDLYQLTMAYAYWRTGLAQREATFHLYFRNNPFGSGFSIACGLEPARAFLDDYGFDNSDLEYLATLRGNDDRPLFERAFLTELAATPLRCDVDAVPEGTAVFPDEPLLRISGPLVQCQVLETPLLNTINFQTLIATKAARICRAAGDDPVIEFGLRRAQGPDGGVAASRAAYVGGCVATSNLLAGKLYGIPVKGTHAHSWVMCFDDEVEAFTAYADALPNNCVFLVDTYDTLEGVRRAVRVGERLRARGHALAGIRLDSGDMGALSIEARRILDDAGFADASILASNDLDEHEIAALKRRGARIDAWGVGTRLATAYDQPALGGVYKLAALRDAAGNWQRKLKLSEQSEKVSHPGRLQVRRFEVAGTPYADAIWDLDLGPGEPCTVMPRSGPPVEVPLDAVGHDLLQPVYRAGRAVATPPPLPDVRQRCLAQLRALPTRVMDASDPAPYPVGLESGLHELKSTMIAQTRSRSGRAGDDGCA